MSRSIGKTVFNLVRFSPIAFFHRAVKAAIAPTAGKSDRTKFSTDHFLNSAIELSFTFSSVPLADSSLRNSSLFVGNIINRVNGTIAALPIAAAMK